MGDGGSPPPCAPEPSAAVLAIFLAPGSMGYRKGTSYLRLAVHITALLFSCPKLTPLPRLCAVLVVQLSVVLGVAIAQRLQLIIPMLEATL
jgi:hypothetical protein